MLLFCGCVSVSSVYGLSFLYHANNLIFLLSLSHECGSVFRGYSWVLVSLWSPFLVRLSLGSCRVYGLSFLYHVISLLFLLSLSHGSPKPQEKPNPKYRPKPDHNRTTRNLDQTINPAIETTANEIARFSLHPWAKIALVESNLLNQKKEPALTEDIKDNSPGIVRGRDANHFEPGRSV